MKALVQEVEPLNHTVPPLVIPPTSLPLKKSYQLKERLQTRIFPENVLERHNDTLAYWPIAAGYGGSERELCKRQNGH